MTTIQPASVPLRDILAAAGRDPHAEALRHKRRGVWHSWSRRDIAMQSEQLGIALRARHPQAALVAVSGDYAPNLLVVALAAARMGAAVVTLPTSLAPLALAARLADTRPDLAFVGLREQVALWRNAGQQITQPPGIVADFHLPWGRPAGAGVASVADLLRPSPDAPPAPSTREALWIEESTDWADGLSYILHALAQTGRTLAFPESRAAAGRDRAEIQPVSLALSASHYQQMQSDLAARLPTGSGPAARLTRSALDAARRGRIHAHHHWVLRRVRRPLGLGRLRDVTVVAASDSTPSNAGNDLFAAFGVRAGHVMAPAHAAPFDGAGFAFA